MTVNEQNGQVEFRGGLLRRLWNDDCGALLATEWILIATILVIGVIPGYIAVRQGALDGLLDFGNAVGRLDQSYSYAGQRLECGCWDRNDKAHNGTERDRSRLGWSGTAKTNRGDHTDWHRNWAIAETAGSQYVKPQRPPLQLKPTTPPAAATVGTNPCN